MSKEAQVEQLTDYMAKFIAHVAKKLPDDVIAKLTELRAQEDSPLSKTIYDTMFQNQELAVKLNRPSCQDTGVLQFWVKCGTNFPLIVSIDTKGNNLFEKNKIEFNKRKDEQIEKISKQVGFIK